MQGEHRRADWQDVRLYTIGHSTRSLEELVSLLRAFCVSVLADVRTIPRSRTNPQFNADRLAEVLPSQGVQYAHLPRLGGLRRPRKDSVNGGWRNASFRGYADYMLTPSFEEGLEDLYALVPPEHVPSAVVGDPGARPSPSCVPGWVALMCAEAVPWRCHRSLVADVLTVRGAHVEHIIGQGRSHRHRVTSFAEVCGSQVSYPGDTQAR